MKSIRCLLSNARWCEHFKSSECMSPVKCKYQTELISVKFPETIFMPTKEAWEKMQAENSRLIAEIAELRERLAIKVGDTIYTIFLDKIKEWQVEKIELRKDEYFVYCGHADTNDYTFVTSKEYGMWWFTDPAKAEARLKKLQEKTVYTVIKNCTNCQHYNVGWAECRAPATANFDCESTHGTCFTQDIIDDECKKHLCVAKLKFDLSLLDPMTGELKPQYFIDEKVAEAQLKEIKEKNND